MHNKLKAKPLRATSYEIALYITHLTNSGLKSTTIRTHLSAIAFFHKIHDYPDPTNSFLIKKLLTAGKKTENPPATRKPITAKILRRLLNSLTTQGYNNYDKKLFTSIFNVMYHAALRASEICKTPFAQHTLKASQLQLFTTSKGQAIKINFKSYKHSKHDITPLAIYACGTIICPIAAYKRYQHVRPLADGLAFINKDHTPICRQQISDVLDTLLVNIGLVSKDYNTHSFRIGKATDMAKQGYSHAQIAMLGRWRSNAFLKYIKPTTIHGTN